MDGVNLTNQVLFTPGSISKCKVIELSILVSCERFQLLTRTYQAAYFGRKPKISSL
jgi:hypothetical protein